MAKATTSKDTKAPRQATGLRHLFATVLATVLKGACWAVPIGVVAKINLDASVDLSAGWAAAGILMAALGAGAVYMALHSHGVAEKTLFGLLAVIFLIGNFSNALGNIAEQSDSSRDTKQAAQNTVATLREELSQLSQDRKDAAATAGSTAPQSVQAELDALKAANSGKWQLTDGCNPEKITAGASRTFCADLSRLAAKKAAAAKRDQLEARIAQINSELKQSPAPESVDSFADAVAEPIALAGYAVDAQKKRLIGVLRNWLRAFILELLGEFGPSILLALLDSLLGASQAAPKPVKSRVAARGEAKDVPAAPALIEAASEPCTSSDDAEIDAFLAACVEFVAGSYVNATPLFTSWQAWCEQHGIDLQSQGVTEKARQMAFSKRIKRRITREANSGRPRYAGIALRTVDTPRLRVVSA